MPEQQETAAPGNESQKPIPAEVAAAAQALETAETVVVDEKERIRDLEARLTKEGRSRAQIKSEMDEARRQLTAMQSQLEAAKVVNEKWNQWYLTNQASPAERETAARQRMSSEAQAADKAKSEAAMLRAILKEEDPVVKQVLTSLADDGRFLNAKDIEALKRGLGTKAVETEEEEEEEKPPKVTPKRTSSQGLNLDQQIKDAKEKKDTVKLLNLLAQKQGLEKQIGG
jgi:hypothetical protein